MRLAGALSRNCHSADDDDVAPATIEAAKLMGALRGRRGHCLVGRPAVGLVRARRLTSVSLTGASCRPRGLFVEASGLGQDRASREAEIRRLALRQFAINRRRRSRRHRASGTAEPSISCATALATTTAATATHDGATMRAPRDKDREKITRDAGAAQLTATLARPQPRRWLWLAR